MMRARTFFDTTSAFVVVVEDSARLNNPACFHTHDVVMQCYNSDSYTKWQLTEEGVKRLQLVDKLEHPQN
eukprot:12922815-Prorocentrum_lima.AAC.1